MTGFWAIHDENALLLSAFPGHINGHPNGRRPNETLRVMSALGQKQTFAMQNVMSALPPIADMCSALVDVRFVPEADIIQRGYFSSAA
jgi:hypothetical protein